MTVPVDRAAPVPGQVIGRAGGAGHNERRRVLALGAAILVLAGVYFTTRSSVRETGTLLPYQMLARDLVTDDQTTFAALKQVLVDAETTRSAAGRWPDAGALTSLPSGAGGSGGAVALAWQRQTQGVITHYVGVPGRDASTPAWMIAIKEPEPGVPTDSAPNDEEHHRLADGTVLHVSIWTHRFGGQVETPFVAQPEAAGWTQVLVAPLNPFAQPFGPVAQPRATTPR